MCMITCNHVTDYISLSKSPNEKHKFLLFKSYSEKNTLNIIIQYFCFFSINTYFFKFLLYSNCREALYLLVLCTRIGLF
jgi:hypothetical protein